MKKFSPFVLCFTLLTACSGGNPEVPQSGTGSTIPSASSAGAWTLPDIKPGTAHAADSFGANVTYAETTVSINAAIAVDFSTDEIKNLKDMEKAYGFTFTAAEKKFLSANKFLIKDLTSTSIVPVMGGGATSFELYREFWGLYNNVKGKDLKSRAPENAVFYTSDIFFHAYSTLFTELLKEMENTTFVPAMKDVSKTFFTAAQEKLAKATTDSERTKWRKVRNYFAVPHAILSVMMTPAKPDPALWPPPALSDVEKQKDKTIDSAENVSAFVKTLKLDAASEKDVLADVAVVYKAEGKSAPDVFAKVCGDYSRVTTVQLMGDWTQFTPRSHDTSSSLRRQYMRAMNWYIQLPFFVKSPAMTEQAFAVTQLMAEHPEQSKQYAKLEAAINFLVGTSDDLMPSDYLAALGAAKGKADPEAAIMDFLAKAHPPKIKSIAAGYGTVGGEETADVLLKTKGMRFFSGKFIIDSYWTGMLTQGDEAVKPGYTQKLPPMASSLEVMALLGSDYAKSRIPALDFYKPETKEAIDQAMKELSSETAKLDRSFWTGNIYHTALWALQGLFSFEKAHISALPRFMQSPLWAIKTLQTASGFWTEMRHATLLYAKQSFAELGGGGPCDPRKIPPPPMSYVEPALTTYDRLLYLAKRTKTGLEEQGYSSLQNLMPLQHYVDAVQKAHDFTVKQLADTRYSETVIEHKDADPDAAGGTCVWYELKDDQSAWEDMRIGLYRSLESALPIPVEGPVLLPKDKRAALVADVHTGGDSLNPAKILYEGTGVPKVIFVAVKDGNGARLTVGFTYAHYEFTKDYGGKRLDQFDRVVERRSLAMGGPIA